MAKLSLSITHDEDGTPLIDPDNPPAGIEIVRIDKQAKTRKRKRSDVGDDEETVTVVMKVRRSQMDDDTIVVASDDRPAKKPSRVSTNADSTLVESEEDKTTTGSVPDATKLVPTYSRPSTSTGLQPHPSSRPDIASMLCPDANNQDIFDNAMAEAYTLRELPAAKWNVNNQPHFHGLEESMSEFIPVVKFLLQRIKRTTSQNMIAHAKDRAWDLICFLAFNCYDLECYCDKHGKRLNWQASHSGLQAAEAGVKKEHLGYLDECLASVISIRYEKISGEKNWVAGLYSDLMAMVKEISKATGYEGAFVQSSKKLTGIMDTTRNNSRPQ